MTGFHSDGILVFRSDRALDVVYQYLGSLVKAVTSVGIEEQFTALLDQDGFSSLCVLKGFELFHVGTFHGLKRMLKSPKFCV